MSDETVYIYILVDPRNNQLFYVGTTINLKARLRAHQNSPVTGKDLKAVLKGIEAQGLKAEMRVIEETTSDHRDERESYWIAKCLAEGVILTNKNVPAIAKQKAGRERWERIKAEFRRNK